ncbi:MAG: DUF1565 domain-containing protein [Kiritimatiellae bacterium]|nr:DUF1565 domain-containing protein [Kiritimatiellia bacterium]
MKHSQIGGTRSALRRAAMMVMIAGCLALGQTGLATTDYYVSTRGNDANGGARAAPFRNITTALSRAEPGDRVVLMPGTYAGPIRVSRSGAPEKPITIISESADESGYAVIDGGYPEGWDEYYLKPGMPTKKSTNHGFVISDSAWLVFENLVLKNCYFVGFKLENANYLVIRGCRIHGAGRAVETNGHGTHHVLVENNAWECVPNDALFEQLEWKEGKSGKYRYVAQSSLFFVNLTGGGGSVIRYNRTRNCFNSLQMWPDGSQHGDNLEIYGNRLGRSLDNVYEPERYVFNQHFYHNVLEGYKGCMVVSVQSVGGGPLYFYGNVCHSGRLIWKMNYQTHNPPYFTDVFHCYHNTFDNGEGVNHDRSFKHWHHFNNIYDMRMGMRNWPPEFMSPIDNHFDHDCTTTNWPDVIRKDGQEEHGLENTDAQFVNKRERDYRLKPSSPCVDRGRVIPGFTQSYEGKAPDIGAYEGDKLVEGPPFYTMVPPGGLLYTEKPRITRHRVNGPVLTIFFSWPIRPATLAAEAVNLTVNGQAARILKAEADSSGREVRITAERDLGDAQLALRFDPLPLGENGATATHWASTLPQE